MKKVWIVVLIVVVLLGGGYFAYEKISDYIAKSVILNIASDPEIQREIDEAIAAIMPSASSVPNETGDSNSETPPPSQKPADNVETSPGPSKEPEEKKTGIASIDKLPAAARNRIMGIVYSKFSASELAELSGFMRGGLTTDEMAQAKKMVKSRLSSAEIKELMQMYQEYSK